MWGGFGHFSSQACGGATPEPNAKNPPKGGLSTVDDKHPTQAKQGLNADAP